MELRPYLCCLSFYLLYIFLPPFEDNGLLFWVPVSSAGIQKLFCGIYSVQMFFWWICGGESGLPVLFLHHLSSSFSLFFKKGTKAQWKARAMLALLEMPPTGFGSPVVSVPILSIPSRQAPGPDREEQVTYAQHKSALLRARQGHFNSPNYITEGVFSHICWQINERML